MGFFEGIFGEKKINAGLNRPDKTYMEDAEVHFKRGEETLARNDLEKALLEFKYAVMAQPEHKGALSYLRGEKLGHLNVKRTTKGQSLFEEGKGSLERGDYKKAITLFNKAINLCPIAGVASFVFRGKAFLMAARYREAIEDFSIALQYSPRVAEAYFERGQAYLKIGNNETATKDFEMAIQLNPQYDEAKKMLQDRGGQPSADYPSRWYFLNLGWAMAPQVYQALCGNEEFVNVAPASAVPQAKVLVRYYRAYDPWGPEQPPYQPEKAEELGLIFKGVVFPLSIKEPPQKIEGLKEAYRHLGGSGSSGTPEVPVIVILADSRFDTMMRGYLELQNRLYMQSGALPIVKLMYTDDLESARNLILLYQLKEKSAHFEERFEAWCVKRDIDPESFSKRK